MSIVLSNPYATLGILLLGYYACLYFWLRPKCKHTQKENYLTIEGISRIDGSTVDLPLLRCRKCGEMSSLKDLTLIRPDSIKRIRDYLQNVGLDTRFLSLPPSASPSPKKHRHMRRHQRNH